MSGRSLIFLDLDGTIEDSRADMAAAANRVRLGFGLGQRDARQLHSLVNQGMQRLYESCFDDYLTISAGVDRQARMEALRIAYETDYAQHIVDTTQLYAGMASALRSLSSRGSLVCYTNKPEALATLLLQRLNVGDLFAAVIGGDSFAESKPSPAPMRMIAARLHAAGKAVMIGDSGADQEAAHNFGAAFLWCAWGYTATPPAGSTAASSPEELPRLVDLALSH
ncbi:MAG: HAD-IA family hydrolase [Leptospirales bacterium]|nr:HAD-IA family hydrolase [Leptospirales bacterium]